MARQAGVKRQAVGAVLEAVPEDLYEAVHCALRPFERAEAEACRRWGSIARLLSLVPVDLAARYGSALDKMLGHVRRNEAQAASDKAAVCVRGLAALDKAADQLQALPPDYVGLSHNGFSYVVALNRLDLPMVERLVGPDFIVVSLQELIEARSIVLTERDSVALETIKKATGGQVTALRRATKLNDALPF